MKSKCEKLDADDAIKRKGPGSGSDEESLKKIQETQDEKFTEIRSLRFGWVKQPEDKDGKTEVKLMTTLPNGKFCHEENTKILMADFTWKPIKDVRPGDKLVGTEHSRGINLVETSVVGMATRDIDCVEIETVSGKTICTPDHRWLTTVDNMKYTETKEIDGMSLVCKEGAKHKITSIKPVGVRKVYSMGTTTHNYIADGYITHNCFPDRSQNLDEIVPEEPYLCLVFDPPGKKVSFAKILFPEYRPKIYIPPSRIPAMVWRDEKGIIHRKVPHADTYEKRLLLCISEMEKLGVESITIVYRRGVN